MIKKYGALACLVMTSACGQISAKNAGNNPDTGNAGTPDSSGIIVKSRASISINAASGTQHSLFDSLAGANYLTGSVPVSVTNSASSTMTLDSSGFISPTISSQLLDFGYLQLTALQDNDLKVCGTSNNQKCGTALIRMYTTGASGAGLYNSTDGYGAPITAGQSTLTTVGLNVAGAATMQSISIPSSTHVLRLSDFTNPKYTVKIDFSNAGAGSYSTTIVVEYALAP